MSEDEMTQEERDEWQNAASRFLGDKTSADILGLYRAFIQVLDYIGPSYDAFDEAVHEFAASNDELSLEIGQLLLEDSDPKIRSEAYWFFEPLVFTNLIAGQAICETMLSDRDPEVVSETIARLTDSLHSVGRKQPFEALVYVAEALSKAKQRINASAPG